MTIWYVIFTVFVLAMLALDLGVFHKENKEVSLKEALGWSAVWISLAVFFGLGVWYFMGAQKSLEFFTGYLIEESLSVDNLFVFLLIFSYFRVPGEYQHKILFWGIIGALVMRGIFIAVGAALIMKFHWILYIFGAFLVYSGIKMAFQKDDAIMELETNPVLRLFKKFVPVTDKYHGNNFTAKIGDKTFATPMLVVLVMIETSDLIFAVDSIPAIFAITRDPFIVYTSNVFAILGLRSMYFALAGVMNIFEYLKYGLAFVLSFIGLKMLLMDVYHIPIGIALGVVAGILATSIIASLLHKKEGEK
ncbi:MAG: TerC family protein [Bacteroidota bacterium]